MIWLSLCRRSLIGFAVVLVTGAPAMGQRLDPNALLGLGVEILRQLPAQPSQQPQRQQQRAVPVDPPRQPAASQATRPRAPAYPAADVAEAQRLLAELGYDPGPVDGAMGPRTANALRAFETSLGLPATGAPGPGTLAALRGQRSVAGAVAAPLASASPVASFDCMRAGTATERAICGSTALADLDVAVAAAFAQRLAASNPEARATILADQRAWLAERDRCAADANCLDASLRTRVAVLGGAASAATAAVATTTDGVTTVGSGPLAPGWQGGTLLIGGRVAATQGLARQAGEVPGGIDLTDNLARLVQDHTVAMTRAFMTDDGEAFELLDGLDPPVREEILSEALQRSLTNSERASFRAGLSTPFLHRLSPFEKQRAIAAIRARADRIVRTDLAPLPIPLRVYCSVQFGQYDFATQSFPIINDGNCGREVSGGPTIHHRSGATWTDALPDRLPHPAETAEAFSRHLSGGAMRTVSFETDLMLEAIESEAGPVIAAAYGPRSNVLLHAEGSYTEVLHRFETTGTDGDAAATEGRAWQLDDAGQLSELLALAGEPKSLPVEARTLFGSETALGTVSTRNPSWIDLGDAEARTGELFFGYGDMQWTERLAVALGVPQEHLVSLGYTGDQGPVAAVFALLPAPRDAYARPLRADGYGRSRVGFMATLRLTGAHAFAIPGQRPVLVVTALPVEGRFVAPGSGRNAPETLETFDLSVPPAFPEHEILSAPPRVVQVVQAAEALGVDPAEVVRAIAASDFPRDPFALEDHVQRLVAVGSAAAEPVETFWIAGEFQIGEYDFERRAFPPRNVALGPIDMLRSDDLPVSAIRLRMEAATFDLPMEPEAARAFAADHPLYTKLPIRARVRVTGQEWSHRGMELSVEPLEAEILQAGAPVTIRDPARVLHRFDFAAPSPEAPPDPARDALIQRLAAMDVGGVRLGMTLEEAEAVVREAIPVGRVGAPSEEALASVRKLAAARAKSGQGIADPAFEPPFLDFLEYSLEDSAQSFMLFGHERLGGRVLAVARRVSVPGADVREALLGQLRERLGDPVLADDTMREVVWSAHPLDVAPGSSGGPGRDALYESACMFGFGWTRAADRLDGTTTPDGEREKARTLRRVPELSHVGSARFERGEWLDCGPAVFATFAFDGEATELIYALLDLAAFAKAQAAADVETIETAAPVVVPKL